MAENSIAMGFFAPKAAKAKNRIPPAPERLNHPSVSSVEINQKAHNVRNAPSTQPLVIEKFFGDRRSSSDRLFANLNIRFPAPLKQ